MGLQSLQYCAFLVVVAAVYLHLPVRMQPVFLLGASWVFYALAMPAMLPVTIALAVFTYLCGRGLAWRGGAHKTAFLRLGVIGMLGILAFFKYNGLLGGVLHGWRAVAMPLGISFTSFAAIAYLIDATRGDCEVETSFIRLALFLNFFATVTQGPICRAGALLPQLSAEHRFDAARTVRALRLYALGLFKYIAVADVLNMVVDTVFPHYADYSAPMLILTAVMYTFYLYFSFSGYSEISRATGLVLGLDLPENFKTPFYATNFSGFWSRWHISFSSWLQDYLFMPLAWADLGRFGRLPTELCVFCVFFASGFWHGSTALSTAIGVARAKKLKKEPGKVVAIIGDGAFTGGMVYEGMNNVSNLNNLIVVLNDNKMSISKNVGQMANYLTKLRTDPKYFRVKAHMETALERIPAVGTALVEVLQEGKKIIRRGIYHSTMFEEMGFQYVGPVDGHDVTELTRIFTNLQEQYSPVFLHIVTQKGKGLKPAEENPGEFHSVSAFDLDRPTSR